MVTRTDGSAITNSIALAEGYGSAAVTRNERHVVIDYETYYELTPKQARRMAAVLNAHADVIETTQLENKP